MAIDLKGTVDDVSTNPANGNPTATIHLAAQDGIKESFLNLEHAAAQQLTAGQPVTVTVDTRPVENALISKMGQVLNNTEHQFTFNIGSNLLQAIELAGEKLFGFDPTSAPGVVVSVSPAPQPAGVAS
jgi:hypothetical protein